MKKKFLSGLLALAVAIPCAFGLVGCGDDPADPASPTHTHAYEAHSEYVIADSKAYKVTEKCSCGDTKKTELEDYVIATTENVVTTIAGAEEGTTVVLSAGEYATIKLIGVESFAENITLLGVTGTEVNGLAISTGKTAANATANDYMSSNLTIKNIHFTNNLMFRNGGIDGIKVLDSKFTQGAGIFMEADTYATPHNYASENEIFGTEGTAESESNFHERTSDKVPLIKNVVIEGCDFSGSDEAVENAEVVIDDQTAIYVGFAENVTVKNNTIAQAEWNGIQLGAEGEIVVENNTMNNTGSRSMRIVIREAETEMSIKNNTMNNSDQAETNSEKIKVTGPAGATVECEGNTYGGEAISTDDQILVSLA